MTPENAIVEFLPVERKRGLAGLIGRRLRTPPLAPGTHLFVCNSRADGDVHVQRVTDPGDMRGAVISQDTAFYRVSTGSHMLRITFPKVTLDDQGNAWDCMISGSFRVSDSHSFLTSFAMKLAGPDSPVTASMTESWFARELHPQVVHSLRDYSVTDLRERQALPPTWWAHRIAEWLGGFGVTVNAEGVDYSSANAAAAETESTRQRTLERVLEAQQQRHELEQKIAGARAEYERQKIRIESDLSVEAQDRAHELELLERKRRAELIEAGREVQDAKHRAELAAVEHEATVARLRNDAEAERQSQERESQIEARHTKVLRELDELKAVLGRLANLPGNLLARVAGRDPAEAYAAAERITSPEIGVPASTLARLGFQVERQQLVEWLRHSAVADGNRVSIRKSDLLTRDIGTAKILALPINTSLQFEFDSKRSGFVTIMNIGTSGSVYLHVPNPYVSVEEAKVMASRPYKLPGDELLPWERLRQLGLDYVEIGPPGWEHLAIVVSDEPLIPESLVARATPDSPFVRFEPEDLDEFCESIAERHPGSWSAAVLSFLVG